jgi:hypothetical protein
MGLDLEQLKQMRIDEEKEEQEEVDRKVQQYIKSR